MKTTMELSVIIHFNREINDTRAIRDHIGEVIEDIIDSKKIFGLADEEAGAEELNVSVIKILKD